MRMFRGIVQSLAKPVDRFVQAQVEINESTSRPKSLNQFLAADHLARPLQQSGEELKRFFLKDEAMSVGAKFARAQVEFELAKAHDLSGAD